MSTPAAAPTDWDAIPDGTQWPGPGTPVLLNRDLRPGTDEAALSRFRDDRWDLNPAIFEDHSTSATLNFGFVPAPLRLTAKFYVWQLLNHPGSQALSRIGARPAVLTIHHTVHQRPAVRTRLVRQARNYRVLPGSTPTASSTGGPTRSPTAAADPWPPLGSAGP